MDNRTSTRALYEAANDQLIGRIIELERVTSVLRLVQTLIVLLEWLIPLLEDVRISRNNLDIIAMLKDNLLSLEAELQRQSCEVREHILARYHRALQGWSTSVRNLSEACDRYRRWSSLQEWWMWVKWMSTAELRVLQLRCMWDLHFVVEKLGDFGIESLENHWKALKKSIMIKEYISTGWSGCWSWTHGVHSAWCYWAWRHAWRWL